MLASGRVMGALQPLFGKITGPVAERLIQRMRGELAADGYRRVRILTPRTPKPMLPSSAAPDPARPARRCPRCGSSRSASATRTRGLMPGCSHQRRGHGRAVASAQVVPMVGSCWLLIADRKFYTVDDSSIGARTGAQALWRGLRRSTAAAAALATGRLECVGVGQPPRPRQRLRHAHRRGRGGRQLHPSEAALVWVVEYEVPDREDDGKGELIALITTITDPAPAAQLARLYHERREHESGNKQKRPNCGAQKDPAVEEPGHCARRHLRIPAHPPRDERADLPRPPPSVGGQNFMFLDNRVDIESDQVPSHRPDRPCWVADAAASPMNEQRKQSRAAPR